MKKRVCLILTAVLLAACLCACGTDKAGFKKEDLSLTVAGCKITPDTSVEDILSALGGDYTYAEAISCVYTGMDKTYTYAGATLYTYPDDEDDRLMELYCEQDVQTSKGITIGAGRDDVIAQYGSSYVETGSILSYELPASASENLPASLYFLITDGKVAAIAITAEHRAE